MIRLVLNELSMNQNEESVKVQLKITAICGYAWLGFAEAAQNVDLANISGKAGKELGNFGMMIQDLTKTVPYLTITELVKETLQRSGYREALMAQNNLESQARLENLDEFYL